MHPSVLSGRCDEALLVLVMRFHKRTKNRVSQRICGVSSPCNDRSFPVNALGPNAGVGDTTQGAGIINCPVPSTCPGDYATASYIFQIERLSRGMKYARFSTELTFSADGDFVVFFEGCCRPSSCSNGVCESNGVVTGVINNAGLPFHIRAGVRVGSDPALPAASFRFTMPDLVMLRWIGVPGPDVCTVQALSSRTLSFALQGFHPEPHFADRVRFRIGTAFEQGLY